MGGTIPKASKNTAHEYKRTHLYIKYKHTHTYCLVGTNLKQSLCDQSNGMENKPSLTHVHEILRELLRISLAN